METRRDVFQAIADPTRREIINLIAHQSLNVKAITEKFDVSRQAISVHLKILSQCGLVIIVKQGRERYCQAKLGNLKQVSDWTDQYSQFWEQKFDSLDTYLRKKKNRDKNNK